MANCSSSITRAADLYRIVPQAAAGDGRGSFREGVERDGSCSSRRKSLRRRAGVLVFKPNTPQWVDYGVPERLVGDPRRALRSRSTSDGKACTSPANSVLTRTYTMEMETGNAGDASGGLRRSCCTSTANAGTVTRYRWNDAQTDASARRADRRRDALENQRRRRGGWDA